MSDIHDDLGDDIAAAMGGETSSQAAETASPAVEGTPAAPDATKTASELARDEAGRFKAKDETAAPAAPKTDAAASPVAATDPAAKPVGQQPTEIPPPPNWKGNGKINWAKLPAPIREEIANDYTRMAQTQARLESLETAIGPQRAQALAATYGSVEGAIKSLLAMSDMASQDAPGFVRWFAQQRGINLSQLTGQGDGQGEQPTQEANPLAQEVSRLTAVVNNLTQQQQHGSQAQLRQEMEQFAADPAHPYFNDVRADMAALIGNGRAGNLKEAYDKAVWANPETRASLITAERERLANEESARVTQARNASVSISGSPVGAKTAVEEPNEDLEGTLRRLVNNAF